MRRPLNGADAEGATEEQGDYADATSWDVALSPEAAGPLGG